VPEQGQQGNGNKFEQCKLQAKLFDCYCNDWQEVVNNAAAKCNDVLYERSTRNAATDSNVEAIVREVMSLGV
jgi:hypothetical protein